MAAAAIVVAFSLVAYFGLTAVRTGALVPAISPDRAASPAIDKKVKVGTVIGSWSSDATPVSYGGTVSTGGLAISMTVICTGSGSLFISLSHVSDQDGSCSGSGGKPQVSSNSGGITKPVVVKIRPHGGRVKWKVVLRTAAPTTFTPKPVRATDGSGQPVAYCTSALLTAKYVHVPEPQGVTGTTTGEIVLTNTGAAQCAVSGYPTGTFVSASGTAIGHHANTMTDTKSYSTRAVLAPVVLQPGKHAYLQFDAGHAGSIDDCAPVPSKTLRFGGDNDGYSAPVTYTVDIPTTQACSNPKVLQLFASIYVDYPSDLRTPAQITKDATCTLDHLAITLHSTPDQAGEQTGALGFTNTGTHSCHLNGTPALTFLAASGSAVGRHTGIQLNGGDPATLDDGYEILGRNKTLYVHFAIQAPSAITDCRPTSSNRLRTTTGEFGYTTTIHLPTTIAACTNPTVAQLRATGFITEKNYLLNTLPPQ